jgi:XTP/dITP diphosphohydrolase
VGTPIRLVLATHNRHKVEELRHILSEQLDGLELVGYDGPEPIEDGATFAENALIKARAAANHTGLPALADDSGIVVEALGGAPGIGSARYAGTRSDQDNLRLLLANLGTEPNRAASFVCAAAFVTGSVEAVEIGEWHGTILDEAVGGGGFGYDPIFKPNGLSVSAAELRPDEKDAISHRALSFGKLIPIVRAALL